MNKKFFIDKNGQLFYSIQGDSNKYPAQCAYKNLTIVPPKIIGAEPSIQMPGCNNNCIFFEVIEQNKINIQEPGTDVIVSFKCCNWSKSAKNI